MDPCLARSRAWLSIVVDLARVSLLTQQTWSSPSWSGTMVIRRCVRPPRPSRGA